MPAEVPVSRAANLSSAITAYRLLIDTKAGESVLHLGGEGSVGQIAAQICESRGAQAISLVSPDVLDPEDAVDVLKNLGATAAAPADFCGNRVFRSVVEALGRPKLLLIDASKYDMMAVNAILLAAAKGTASGRKAVEAADPVDVRDAKVIQTCASLCGDGAKVLTYNEREGDGALLSVGAESLNLDEFLDDSTAEMSDFVSQLCGFEYTVLSEAHDDATLPRALHVANGAVYKHAYRQPLWLADEA